MHGGGLNVHHAYAGIQALQNWGKWSKAKNNNQLQNTAVFVKRCPDLWIQWTAAAFGTIDAGIEEPKQKQEILKGTGETDRRNEIGRVYIDILDNIFRKRIRYLVFISNIDDLLPALYSDKIVRIIHCHFLTFA